jgi:30S ribosomal protein S17
MLCGGCSRREGGKDEEVGMICMGRRLTEMSDRNVRKVRVGKVVSDKMDKTVVVAVEELEQHKMYKKPVKKTVKFHAHDEKNDAHIGDRVSIMETRPLSKTKRWRVVEIVERAK